MGPFERTAVSSRSKRLLDFYGLAIPAGLRRVIGAVWLTSHNRKNEILANGEITAKFAPIGFARFKQVGALRVPGVDYSRNLSHILE
jgi:hypothetical protein